MNTFCKTLGPIWWKQSAIQTQVSQIGQDTQPGRDTITDAITNGDFSGFEVLDESYRDQLHFEDDAGTAFPFTCARKICDPNDPQAIVFKEHLEAKFRSINPRFFHTR